MAKVSKAHLEKRASKTRSKTGRHCKWTIAMIASAVAAVWDHGLSQWEACKTFHIPRCTFQMRLAAKTEEGTKPGRPTMLSHDQEKKIVDYACNCAAMRIRFAQQQFIKYAGNLAAKLIDCLSSFLTAHTHTQPFYGSGEFVRENPGEPVPEETFTHYSHRSHQSSLSAFSI